MALKSGSVVQAKCGACRADTRHLVLKAARGVPSRVRCRSCGREHAYKPKSVTPPAASRTRPPAAKANPVRKPNGKPTAVAAAKGKPSAPPPAAAAKGKPAVSPTAAAGKPAPSRAAPAAAKGGAASRTSPAPVREPELPPYEKALKEAENRAPEAYRISGVFRERQRLQHAVFGLGVVTKVLQSNVFEAIFPDGPRKMAMAREEPKRGRGMKVQKPITSPPKAAPVKAAPVKAAPAKSAPAKPKTVPAKPAPAPARRTARPAATAKASAKARRR